MTFILLTSLILITSAVYGGELEDQFSRHPKKHVFASNYDPLRSSDHGIKEIGIEHMGCLGTCPVFTVIIKADGSFRYHGEQFSKKRGDYTGRVCDGCLEFVLRYVSEMGFFDLDDSYDAMITDVPATYTMVKTRTKMKIVYNSDKLGPAKLGALEDMIDELLEHDVEWHKIPK